MERIKLDDLVIILLKSSSAYAVGKIVETYWYRSEPQQMEVAHV